MAADRLTERLCLKKYEVLFMKEDKYKDLLKLVTVPVWIYCSVELLYCVISFILYVSELYNAFAVMAEISLFFSIMTLYFALPVAAVMGLLSMAVYHSIKNKSIKPLLNVRLWVTIVVIAISTVCRFELISNNF